MSIDLMCDNAPDVLGGPFPKRDMPRNGKVVRAFKIVGRLSGDSADLFSLLTLHPWLTKKLNISVIDASKAVTNRKLLRDALAMIGSK